jgi:hypothetical protein
MALTDDELAGPERRLWQAASTGRLVNLQPDQPVLDPARGASWGPDCTVRAEVLIELFTGAATASQAPHPRAVKLRGARITGALYLEAATLACPLELRSCSFEKPVNLRQAQASEVRLPHCHVPRLAADQLETRGSLALTEGFTATGEVSLAGARIGGQLYCDDARLHNPGRLALDASGATVGLDMLCHRLIAAGQVRLDGARINGNLELDDAELTRPPMIPGREGEQEAVLHADGLLVEGSMFCRNGFTAEGEVRLPGARIGRQLDFQAAALINPRGWALTADDITTGGSMFCGEGLEPSTRPFTAEGEVAMPGAHVGGQLSLKGARLRNPRRQDDQQGRAFSADDITVGKSMYCKGCTAEGEVRLPGARIGRQLDLTDAELNNPDGWALNAAGLNVNGDMTCQERFRARGGIRLIGAHIGGTLNFSGARLSNRPQGALLADRLIVEGDLRCEGGFTADGEVGLVGAQIGGQLSFTKAILDNPGSPALFADGLTVKRNMRCGKEFVAKGEVRLPRARISDGLRFEDALIAEGSIRDDGDREALQLQGLSVPVLTLKLRQPPAGMVDLVAAQVGVFVDEQKSWPPARRLRLRGFTYDTLHNTEIGVKARLGWLARDTDGYSPQLYEQLAAAYRRIGHEETARRVALEKQRRRRSALNPLGRAGSWLLDLTVGYGYRTWQAAVWLLGLLLVGTWVFDRAYPVDMVAAKRPAPPFHPVVYTLDVLLPIVDLGQQSAWLPRGAALGWSWVLIGAGWVLTTAVVAGLTGILKRD